MSTGPEVAFVASERSIQVHTRAGHTTISSRALTGVVEAVTAEVFGVPVQNLRTRLRDDQGMLWVSVAVPMAVPVLRQTGGMPDGGGEGSLYDRADESRRRIIERTHLLTGYVVGRVDLRLMGEPPARHGRRR